MSAKLWKASTSNAFQTTLNGNISSSDTNITLTSVTGLQAPGVLCLDRQDANNVDTPTIREYIGFTGISTNTLTGCTRGLGGSSAQAHNSGAKVEETMDVNKWGDMIDFLGISHDSSGNIVATSTATLPSIRVYQNLNASGASITGWPITTPVFNVIGNYTNTASNILPPLVMPRGGIFRSFSFVTRTVASGVSAVVDIKKNGSSIFDAGTRPLMAAGGTFVSTASIASPTFVAGDMFTIDYLGSGGSITDFSVVGNAR